MGKVTGRDLCVLQDGGIPLSDPSLRSQRGARPPPLESPAIAGVPPALPCFDSDLWWQHSWGVLSAFTQPSPQRDPSRRLGGLGGPRADPKQGGTGAKRRGWGGGEAVDHPAVVESRQTYLASMTLGAGLESWLPPPSVASLRSGWKLPWLLFSMTRAKGISCFSGLSSGPSEETTSPMLFCCNRSGGGQGNPATSPPHPLSASGEGAGGRGPRRAAPPHPLFPPLRLRRGGGSEAEPYPT